MAQTTPSLAKFPADLLLGVATADHQCEAHEPGQWPDDVRDAWDAKPRGFPRRRATDFWQRYPDDIALAKQLGCTAFRFSTAWARLQQSPRAALDPVALNHYRKLIQLIQAAEPGPKMEPILTLHHFTWPEWLEQSPVGPMAQRGLLRDDFPELFTDYAAKMAKEFPDVKYWLTFNEPNHLIFGYLRPPWENSYLAPPGGLFQRGAASEDDQLRHVAKLMRNLFRAHALARQAIRDTIAPRRW